MRKGFLMVLAVALVAVLAAPAMAGTDINGFYRAKGYTTNFDFPSAPSISNDMHSGGYVEQRLRMRFSFGEENVKAIAFFEIDFSSWGDAAGGTPVSVSSVPSGTTSSYTGGASRNSGGALGGDRINLETKNVYVWFKVPDTSLDFAVGLQNQTDNFQGLLYGAADMAGIFATGKFEPVNWKLGWAKLYENQTNQADDLTLYMGSVAYAPTKDLKLGLSLYAIQSATMKNTTTFTGDLPGSAPASVSSGFSSVVPASTFVLYTPGIDFAWNAGPVALSGFFLYQFGALDAVSPTAADWDVSGFAADLRVDANVGPGKLFVEGLVLSGGNNTSNKYQSVVTLSDLNASPGGNSNFSRLDYQILMSNADDINQNTCLLGCAGAVANSSPGNGGLGMWTVGLGYSMKAAEKVTFKLGAGYLAAMKKAGSIVDTDMGTEFNGNVNYNIMKGLDFGLYAAYAMIGDFFAGTSSTNNDPDSVWSMFFRLNYAF